MDLDYLISDVENALSFSGEWEITREGPSLHDHEHCLICWDMIDQHDCQTKVRQKAEKEVKRASWQGYTSTFIHKSESFLCWYCYERFIVNNGIAELRKLLTEEGSSS